MLWSLSLALRFYLSVYVVSATLDINVDVRDDTGAFTVSVNDRKWFGSGETFFRANGKRHSSADGSLTLRDVQYSTGSDGIGSFASTELLWATAEGVRMTASVKQYESCVVFGQSFPDGAQGTSSGDADSLVSGFPTFAISNEDEPAGYTHWISWYWVNQSSDPNSRRRQLLEAKGFDSPVSGRWTESSLLYGGVGGSGVTCVFNEGGSIGAVLSPFDAFMAASQQSTENGVRSMGLMGNVTEIPVGYSMQSILFFGEGIQAAVDAWGAVLRKNYNKPDLTASGYAEGDISLSYLGYTTDNGAYYYYQTVPGKNYQDTILDIKAYADSLNLPYRYILLDSWWYYRGENGGVTNWEPQPDIFPDGIEYLYNQTGWLVQAHNRYWSDEAVYAKQNGGNYEFLLEESTGGAVPLEQEFWDDFLREPRSAWGLRVYEQDWLWNEYNQYVPAFLTSVSLGRTWLQQMANGAEKNGLSIQYCMPHIRHILQSVEFPVVTQARASDDYKPGEDTEQWRIGGQSLLFSALGLAPSKDGFWSTSVQPGNPYGEASTEPTPRLQSAVLTLSRGPIAVADGIGYSDANLIMKSCRQDGRLLQPSRPAVSIDAMLLQAAFGGMSGPDGEVWLATTDQSGQRYGHLLVADLKRDWILKPSQLGYPKSSEFWVFESNDTDSVLYFSDESPLKLKACGTFDFSLWTIVPIVRIGGPVEAAMWTLMGETEKWIPVSESRFRGLTMASDGAEVTALGAVGEKISVAFADPVGVVSSVQCVFDSRQALVISSVSGCM